MINIRAVLHGISSAIPADVAAARVGGKDVLRGLLAAGKAIAFGRRGPPPLLPLAATIADLASPHEPVPRETWLHATLHGDRAVVSGLEGADVIWHGLLVRLPDAPLALAPPAPPPALPAPPPPGLPAPPPPGLAAAREWMREHVTAAHMWKRDVAVADCQRATGCSRAQARQAWSELPAGIRTPRGRRTQPP